VEKDCQAHKSTRKPWIVKDESRKMVVVVVIVQMFNSLSTGFVATLYMHMTEHKLIYCTFLLKN